MRISGVLYNSNFSNFKSLRSAFRDSELFDVDRDICNPWYKRYDHNDVPLSLPSRPLPIPHNYMTEYGLIDARDYVIIDKTPYLNSTLNPLGRSATKLKQDSLIMEHSRINGAFDLDIYNDLSNAIDFQEKSPTLMVKLVDLSKLKKNDGTKYYNQKLFDYLDWIADNVPVSEQGKLTELVRSAVVNLDNREFLTNTQYKIMRDAIEAGNINIKALAKELAYSKEAFLLATNTLREIRAKI